LAQKIVEISKKEIQAKQKEDLIRVCNSIIDANKLIRKIINAENNQVKVEKNLIEKEIKLDETAELDKERQERIISELKKRIQIIKKPVADILKQIEQEQNELANMSELIKNVKEINAKRIRDSVIIIDEFEKLKKNIDNQDVICRNLIYFSKGSFFSKTEELIKGKNIHIDHIGKLSKLIIDEIESYNQTFRLLYNNVLIPQKESTQEKILWLCKQKQEVNKDMNLLIRQLEINRIKFMSNEYVTYPCSIKTAMETIQGGILDEKSGLSAFTKQMRFGIANYPVSFIDFMINDIEDKGTNEVHKIAFIFDFHDVVNNSFFTIQDNKRILKFIPPQDPKMIIEEAKKISGYFDGILKECDQKFDEWIEEAKKLDVNFQVKWDKQAKEMIFGEFAKRWIRDMSSYEKNRDVYGILTFYEHIEDVQKFNKQKFMEKIIELKRRYNDHVDKINEFFTKSRGQPIKNGLFIAPRNSVLYWERFFEEKKVQPNVFYYDGDDLKNGLNQALEECIILSGQKKRDFIDVNLFLMPEQIAVKKGK